MLWKCERIFNECSTLTREIKLIEERCWCRKKLCSKTHRSLIFTDSFSHP